VITAPGRRRVGIDFRSLPDAVRAHALDGAPLAGLLERAQELRNQGTGRLITFSPKVFIPLTQLCRDVCHYCTFAGPPKPGERAFMTPEEVLKIAQAGAEAGCHEALFTLGDKPELRYKVARDELAALGHETTISYLVEVARLVLEETGLLPHANPGVLTHDDLRALRAVSPSQGIMLESVSERLMEKGEAHHGSPDKDPTARLATLEAAGDCQVPFTSGILIGIGETRAERIDALLAIRDLHARHGHIQEVIIQNFRAKAGTKMHASAEPDLDDLLWTTAVARIVLGPSMNIQVPPNLSYDDFPKLLDAGINDWGGISPVTIDHVNPEAPWPELEQLREATEARGFQLAPRLPLYPEYLSDLERWCDPAIRTAVLRRADASGLGREGRWASGAVLDTPPAMADLVSNPASQRNGKANHCPDPEIADVLARQRRGDELGVEDTTTLFAARGESLRAVLAAADALRRDVNGDTVSYVVTRNINYTNVCYFKCGFCAFSKGKLAEELRGKPYLVPTEEILRRCHEAWDRGAVEVCLQGGIHPGFTGDYYAGVLEAIKAELPDLHVHAFSALEVWQGAATLDVPLRDYLARLRAGGLGSLPGTAAEILDDEARAVLCPDKVNTEQWLEVHRTAHEVGLRSTTTIMYGSIEWTHNWARHLIALRSLQKETGGFTEFVPLPFVHMEAPIYLKGTSRPGPTFREALLMHAVGRLVLHPHITNIQVSWVKMGIDGAKACLNAGANDMGGTLMNESISRAAGASHGQECPPEVMEQTILSAGRTPRQRTTIYGTPDPERTKASFGAAALVEPLNPHFNDTKLERPKRLIRPGLVGSTK
jgi:FO synthase